MKKKKIPCRVCGKLFEPCAACQSKTSAFTWRNFACSRKCATTYINQATQYREDQKNKSISSEPSTIEQSKYNKEKLETSKNNKEDNFINKEQKNVERKRKIL